MSDVYNYLRDGGMILKIKPTITNCNTLKVFSTFDVGLKHLLTVANGIGTGRYTGNELIQIIANTVNNYYFSHWNDPNAVVTDVNSGTTTVTMPFLDCTVTAVILPYRTLTVNNGSGSNNLLKPGDVRQIVANAPATNYVFDNWTGDTAYLSANTSSANITMPDANVVLTANYRVNYQILHYGLYYNWWAANDVRNIANVGWHLATTSDVSTLETYLGGSTVSGGKLKEIGSTYWNSGNIGASNQVGFNGRGSGQRDYASGAFTYGTTYLIIWQAGSYGTNQGNARRLAESANTQAGGGYDFYKTGDPIRLVKDSTTLTHGQIGVYIGNDGKIYRTICIGTQEWLADNLAETKYRNGDSIPEVTSNSAWMALSTGALCAMNNDWNNV